MGGMAFEYDEQKNQINIRKHGLSFKSAARVFFDYDRIEFYDDTHSDEEPRYDTIGDTSAGKVYCTEGNTLIGKVNEILFVVYTERIRVEDCPQRCRKSWLSQKKSWQSWNRLRKCPLLLMRIARKRLRNVH